MAIGGLDIGTSGCKVTLFDEKGEIIASAYSEYSASFVYERHELDARVVWKHVQTVLEKAAKDCPDELEVLTVSTIGEPAVLVDSMDNILAPSILYTDPRGAEECVQLVQKMGKKRIMEITGAPAHEMYTLPKLMWMIRYSDVLERTDKILLFQDFIIYMLTGESVISHSIAARTMAFDIRKKEWSAEILDVAGIDVRKFSKPLPSGVIAGTIKPALAEKMGLSKRLQIVTGAHDQCCAAIGAGIVHRGVSVDGTGTCECISVLLDEPNTSDFMINNDLACVPHAIDGKYLTYLLVLTSGAMLKWYRNTFLAHEAELCRQRGENLFQKLDAQAGDMPSGLLVLPQFSASGTPHINFSAKGAVWGLTIGTTAVDLYRALMEGATYQMLMTVETLAYNGIDVGKLRATGGGASSALWLQMKADILGREIESLTSYEAGTAGGMMLAAVAIGRYKNLEDAANRLVKPGRVFRPNLKRRDRYMEYYEKYKKLYRAISEI
jgi:xylulokinase